jgi:hypothetical protein
MLKGRDLDNVRITGCPSIDLAAKAKELGPLSVAELVVLQHPVTTEVSLAGQQMQATIEALAPLDDRVLWFWPGEDAGSDDMSKALRMAGIKPRRNMAPLEFLRTLLGARALIGNSSVGIRECSYLGVPVVNIGSRQQRRERGPNVVDVSHDKKLIRSAVYRQASGTVGGVELYGDGKSGARIAGILGDMVV